MFTTVRAIIAIFSGCLFALGLLLITVGGPAAPAGIWPVIAGGIGVIAIVLERQRYRSQAAERDREPIGPGGGEPAALPPNFRATDERFVDPTSGHVMRVYIDDRTGEQRYRADS